MAAQTPPNRLASPETWSTTLAGMLFDLDGLAGANAMPGAAALLDAINGVLPWGIVTSGTFASATARLSAAGLPTPPVLVSGEDLRIGKPDPEPYLIALERLAANGPVVVIEDAPAGVRSGRDAGCPVVAVAISYPADQLAEADAIVPNLQALELTAPDRGDAPVLTAIQL